jgi:hypothetical protein
MRGHLENLYVVYGELRGVRIARIYIAWSLQQRSESVGLRQRVNRVETVAAKWRTRDDYFNRRELGT